MVAVTQITLLALLAVSAIALLRIRNLFAVVMLGGIYSLVSAALFTSLDAVDVAFTEAAVGAGISTVLLLGTLALVGHEAKPRVRRPLLPLFVVMVTGGVLVYGTLDMPPFGDPANPAHHHVAPRYVEESPHEIGIPNMVTSVLASYRGYDTMGETTVVFTALVAVLLLIGMGPNPRQVSWKSRGSAEPGAGPEDPEDERTEEAHG
jgi:multicomponent Na+:H+ antiporter subunit B